MQQNEPVLSEGDLIEKAQQQQDIGQQWKGQQGFVLKQSEGATSRNLDRIMQQLQSQNQRIEQIISHLMNQNQLLGGFQKDVLLKLGENTKAALRQQLNETNKQTVKDFKAIKNTNNTTINMLLNHERRLGKIQEKLQFIWEHLGARQSK